MVLSVIISLKELGLWF